MNFFLSLSIFITVTGLTIIFSPLYIFSYFSIIIRKLSKLIKTLSESIDKCPKKIGNFSFHMIHRNPHTKFIIFCNKDHIVINQIFIYKILEHTSYVYSTNDLKRLIIQKAVQPYVLMQIVIFLQQMVLILCLAVLLSKLLKKV